MEFSKFLSLIILSIFLITSVSAATFLVTSWEDGNSDRTIDYGESAEFDVYASCANPPLIISIKLYDSENNPIHPFQDGTIEDSVGAGYIVINPFYQVDESVYQNSGEFQIRVKYSDAAQGTQTKILTLTVNPVPEPENNPPAIISTPITEVNEHDFYSYQVIATDADGDTLIYSLTEKPSWLSISPSGLVTGTAREVSEDRDYSVIIKVSDSKNPTIQDYILTVKNIDGDITNPTITILGENQTDVEVFSDYVDSGATAYDNVDGDITNNIIVSGSVNTNIIGTYILTYNVQDSSSNSANPVTRIVNVVDTTNPTINLLGENPQVIELGELYTELGATAEDNYDEDLTNNISIDISDIDIYVLGSYEIFYTISDSSGNEEQVIRIFKIVSEIDDDDDDGPSHSYRNVDEIKYFKQFTKPESISYTEETPKTEKETNWLILNLIIGILILIIFIIILLIKRLKY